eukprot:1197445-Pyramimonas_sp.AAC.1
MDDDLLTDKQRCDAWELGIQVATLQARGVRELHMLLDRAKEELTKQIWVQTENLNAHKEETAAKIVQCNGELKCLRAELITEKTERKELEQQLERERNLARELRDRMKVVEQECNNLTDQLKEEIHERQTLEAVHGKRINTLEVDQVDARRDFNALDTAYQTNCIEVEARHKSFVSESRLAVLCPSNAFTLTPSAHCARDAI